MVQGSVKPSLRTSNMAAHLLLLQQGHRKERKYRRINEILHEEDDDFLRARYRFSRASILHITDLIRDEIERPTKRSHSLSPEDQVLVALRYYASGSFLQVVGDHQGLDKGTVSRVLVDVSNAIANLKDQFIKWPTEADELATIRNGFYAMAQFPNVFGSVDGTHVRIQAPSTPAWYPQGPDVPSYESTFVNRKQFHSINNQAICDHRGESHTTDTVSHRCKPRPVYRPRTTFHYDHYIGYSHLVRSAVDIVEADPWLLTE